MVPVPALSQPVQDPADLAAALSVTRLDLTFAPDLRLTDDPALPARIRGAWGQRLRQMSEDGHAEAATARAWFFPDKIMGGGSATPPYRIACALRPDGLHLSLLLIGFAARWREVAFDALIAALTEPPGLVPDDRAHAPIMLTLTSADWTRSEGVLIPDPAPMVVLEFQTPLRLGPVGVLGTRFSDVIVGLADRAADTAPWIGMAYRPDLGQWRDRAKALRYHSSDLRPVVWDSFSSHSGRDRAAGYLGRLRIAGADGDVMALLALGTVLHAGGMPSKGCGRYQLYGSV